MIRGSSGTNLRHWPPMSVRRATKLEKLRGLMRREKVRVFVILSGDEHASEYVAAADRRIAYFSGFTGSAGTAIIGLDSADLATDSRYHIQAERQVSSEWHVVKLGNPGVVSWEDTLAKKKGPVGMDPTTTPFSLVQSLRAKGIDVVPVPDLVVELWGSGRPQLPNEPIWQLPLAYTGETWESKVERVRNTLDGVDALLVYSLPDIAWFLNLRGSDVPYNPLFKAFVVVSQNVIRLYGDLEKLQGVKSLYCDVDFRPYNQIWSDLKNAKESIRWWVPDGMSWALAEEIQPVRMDPSPLRSMRDLKNPIECSGEREASRKCSLSFVKYFAWLSEQVKNGIPVTEYQGSLKILEIRETLPDFKGLSYESISCVGGNASSPHYAPDPQNDKYIITDKEVYLLDSGSHFLQGSTDITRTVHFGIPTDEERLAYTAVLRGNIAVARSTFPEATSGGKLDIVARQFLWQLGLDYSHGSGHGVGSYNTIHELPIGIGMSYGPESYLRPGNFVTIEPGYYEDGIFGVRVENDILCVRADPPNHFLGRQFCKFEPLTLVPYDRNLLDITLLRPDEIEYIDNYHAKCREILYPDLTEAERTWLDVQTEPIRSRLSH